MRDLSTLAMELANACVPSAESELPLASMGRAVLVGNAYDRILAALKSVTFDQEPPAFVKAADVRTVIDDFEIRQELARICEEALKDADEVLADPRGIDVLLDAIVCLFRDAARDVPTMTDDEAYEYVRNIYAQYGVTPKLREAYEFYLKNGGHLDVR